MGRSGKWRFHRRQMAISLAANGDFTGGKWRLLASRRALAASKLALAAWLCGG
jgi:hypothetical protein